MTTSAKVTSETFLEIKIGLSGSIDFAEPDVGLSDEVREFEITDVSAQTVFFKSGVRIYRERSLLDGIDRSNPEVQKLLSNLECLIADEAREVLLIEVGR